MVEKEGVSILCIGKNAQKTLDERAFSIKNKLQK